MAACSAARTRETTAEMKPSSQLRRHARGLRLQSGTSAAARPCHICSSSDVYSTSVRSMSDANPKMWMRVPGPGRGSSTHWHRRAAARPQSRWAWTRAHGLSMSIMPVGGVVGLRPARGEQGPVDAVLGHQLGRLGRQRFRLGRGHALGLRLGEQLAHAVEQGGGGLGCLGIHGSCLLSGTRIERRFERYPDVPTV